jgi:hypothetical protein
MACYVDFSWKADSRPLSTTELEEWESIIRKAMGGSGWVVMRQVHGIWQVEEARLLGTGGQDGAATQTDRRTVVIAALRQNGKTVGA